MEGSIRVDVRWKDARGIERQSLQNNHQTSNDVRFRMLGRKEEIWEQTQFRRNEDVEMSKREDQVGPHQKWRHQEGGARNTCWSVPGKQKTKVVWPLLDVRTQPHLCEIAKTRGLWEKSRGRPKKRRRGNIQGDMKKYQLTEDMAQDRIYCMTKILAGPAQGDGQERLKRIIQYYMLTCHNSKLITRKPWFVAYYMQLQILFLHTLLVVRLERWRECMEKNGLKVSRAKTCKQRRQIRLEWRTTWRQKWSTCQQYSPSNSLDQW